MSDDDDLTDGIGIDSTYAAKLAQLAASGTVFGPGSTGSAVAVTNPEGETTVRISDGIGRIVMSIDVEGNTSIISYDELITPVQLASSQPIPAATPSPRRSPSHLHDRRQRQHLHHLHRWSRSHPSHPAPHRAVGF